MKFLAKKLKDLKVLIVEDDDEIRKRLSNTLKFYFKKTYEANSGEDGYESFIENKPNLCILDIEMKNGNGIELVKKIRKISYSSPIIILSAYSKEEYLLELINFNINQYILKPATNENLLTTISNALFKDKTDKIEISKNIFLDLDNNQLIYNEQNINLRKKEKHFLELLYNNKNKIVNYDMIEEYVWANKFMTQNALKVFIKELRKKLPINIIENIINEGYKIKNL
jgi:DNA-binding response OmpR family regulator